MSKKSVSIKDIAKLAGVSIATVSRVINRNGKVAPETEKKILQVMEENHYVPNLLAKGFKLSEALELAELNEEAYNKFKAAK